MDIILFDTEARSKLFPLALTRAIAEVRIGILTVRERWEKIMGSKVYILTEPYLQPLYREIIGGDYIFLDATIIPTVELVKKIKTLKIGEALKDKAGLISGRATIDNKPALHNLNSIFNNIALSAPVKRFENAAQIFQWNEELLNFDFELLTKRRFSSTTTEGVHLINAPKVFIEEGAELNFSILNASAGPVYIGRNALVMENCSIRGPFALGEGAVLKMGTKVYGATSIGPYCTVGGEIKNSVIAGFSNKAHDGYLGDSVIGEWCNLGAGTTNSNVKNTGGEVNLWNYELQNYQPSGKKCGVIMGDYSRTAINSSINTGTVVGVCCNVFGEGLTPKFIPDFSWGSKGDCDYEFGKAISDIENWKKMKNKTMSEPETSILKHIFEQYRRR